ncbi:cytochrome P450 [Glonium stellatum]|uniref:Cytochrome P450 n=1 Tax=Glonium stellatum TaxID=574774 RepID=A0A8E2FG35_9PEZI|nr:cytochrome P450 [Glonium stellatum]
MHIYAVLSLSCLACFVVYQIASIIISNRRHAARARELNCKMPPRMPCPDPFGVNNIRKLLKSDREKRMPEYLIERSEEVSRLEGRNVSTMVQNLLGNDAFFTFEPKNIQAVLATQFKDFCLGDARNNNLKPLLGSGIFATDGKQWEHSRAMLRPQFIREQVSDLNLEERHVQNMMRALSVKADGWTELTNIQPLFFRLTLDSATEFLFGESVDSQLAELPGYVSHNTSPIHDEKLFAYHFDRSQAYLAKAARFGDGYWMAHNSEFKHFCKQVHDFVDRFVQIALNKNVQEKLLESGESGKGKYVFLEAIAAETKDPVELRDQLLNILLAGRDTTASLLGWIFLMLLQHPTAFNKLRETVLHDFGSYTEPRNLTFSGLKNCTYLQWVMNETLRLFPIVPLNGRRALRNTTIPVGGGPDGLSPVYIRKGQQVDYSVHVMHHRRDLWGEDADNFNPERWNGRKPGWEYLPFNGGPRICIGQQFALTEAGYVVVRLLQRFEAIDGEVPTRYMHGVTLTSCPGDGVTVRLKETAA